MAKFDLTSHPHKRFDPLRRQWILVSPHRTERPWQGSPKQVRRIHSNGMIRNVICARATSGPVAYGILHTPAPSPSTMILLLCSLTFRQVKFTKKNCSSLRAKVGPVV